MTDWWSVYLQPTPPDPPGDAHRQLPLPLDGTGLVPMIDYSTLQQWAAALDAR